MDFLFRRSTYLDLPDIMQIMREAAKNPDHADWFQPDEEQYVADHINKDGFIVVAQAPDGSIAGFFMIHLVTDPEFHLGKYLDYTPELLMNAAVMDSAVVSPAWRGFRLQRRMGEEALNILFDSYRNIRRLLCTVHPDNLFSLHNMEQLGLVIRREIICYGGKRRLLLERVLEPSARSENRPNYQRLLESVLEKEKSTGRVPTLLLHSCCAPCSSYVFEYLAPHFAVTDFFYNPNIYPETEYRHRVEEIRRLVRDIPQANPIRFVEGRFCPQDFYQAVKGLEQIPEGGARCFECFRLRLSETARMAAEGGFDYFTTTLTISPLKNAAKLNEIGMELARQYHVSWLPSDFKKKGGYQRSIELSRQYDLYRQDYCGCVFSREERRVQKETGESEQTQSDKNCRL